MKLVAKAGYPPLAVNSSTTVPYLSADRLDGLSSGAFARAGGQTGSVSSEDTGGSDWADTDNPPDGVPNEDDGLIIPWATCPAGTRLTGGGYDNITSGYTVAEFGDVDTWVVLSDSTPGVGDVPEDLLAYAVCYSPRGAVPGASAAAAKSSTELSPAAQAKMAKVAAKHSR